MAYAAYGEKSYLSRAPPPRTFARTFARRYPQRAIYIILAVGLALTFLVINRTPSPSPSSQSRTGSFTTQVAQTPAAKSSNRKNPPCRNLPGADDVVVILKTGSTELQDKLPIHFSTTLRCYSDYILFSDYEETFQGEHIYDALEHVSPKIQEEHPDFELWRRLREGGRAALQPQELSGPVSRPTGNGGKKANPGWRLDKWKFLPMVNRTLHEFPDKKWYLFVETDTYVQWQGLLTYLKVLDWTQPLYMGAPSWIGSVEFAHGGSGFLASRTAMKQVVEMFQARQAEWEAFTSDHWAGDAVLGKAMKDAGSPIKRGWPIWQGDDIGAITWERVEKVGRQWCMPAVSYHHLSPSVVESLWEFEQDWISKTKGDPSEFLRHKDMYAQYVLPRITNPLADWDNHADNDRGPVPSLEACRKICVGEGECVQYSITPDFRCMSTTKPNLGEYSKGVESGWIPDRMKQFSDNMEPCTGDAGWII